MVTGTTRSAGAASIITGSGAPQRWARYSVWPGKAKPAPCLSTALLIGLVQTASASPLRASATARAMISTTARGVARVGVAEFGRMRQRMVEDREAGGHRGGGGAGDLDRAHRQGEAGGERGHVGQVGDQEEGGAVAERGPGLQGDLAADAGGVAERQRDRGGHRLMMSASPSSSCR